MSETPTTPGTLFRYEGFSRQVFMILDKERLRKVLAVSNDVDHAVITIALGRKPNDGNLISWWGSIANTLVLTPDEAMEHLEKYA